LHAVFDRTRMPDVEPELGADGLGMAVLGRWPVLARQRHELPTDLPGDPASLVIVIRAPHGAAARRHHRPVWERDA
jgi:hypothetical protein